MLEEAGELPAAARASAARQEGEGGGEQHQAQDQAHGISYRKASESDLAIRPEASIGNTSLVGGQDGHPERRFHQDLVE